MRVKVAQKFDPKTQARHAVDPIAYYEVAVERKAIKEYGLAEFTKR
jgi:hypothetical protein